MSEQPFRFEVLYQSTRSAARLGRIHTPHGIIDTPAFVPVGTNGVLKSLLPDQVADLQIPLIFCNTYHLLLHPGPEVIAQAGGLHAFMKRTGPLITDSGGFQVFSLAYGGIAAELKSQRTKKTGDSVVKITEEGVHFRSYRNGDMVFLTPESSIMAQKSIGADIIVSFDELPPYHISPSALEKSLHRTHRWQLRSLEAHQKERKNQALYAVIHGGSDPALRSFSAQFLQEHSFDGFGIGGSLGKTKEEMYAIIRALTPFLPAERPVHLLGVGDIPSLAVGVTCGIDTFDSSYPTKCARHGILLTSHGPVKITQSRHRESFVPLDPSCTCGACRQTTRAYLHHLFKAHELSAYTIATIHNLAFMNTVMAHHRHAIGAGLL